MAKIKKRTIANDITVYFIYPKTGQAIKGIVFAPPLIGGSYYEQYATYYSAIGESGYLFVSFNYRGHKNTPGTFTLKNSMEDSLQVARYLRETFPQYDLFGLGSCYGAVPLLYCLHNAVTFKKIALVNAISNIRQASSRRKTTYLIIKSVLTQLCTCKKVASSEIFSSITRKIFSNIDQSNERFGLLYYKNTDFLQFITQYFFTNFRKKLINPPSTLCCYGTKDDLLGLDKVKNRQVYEKEMAQCFQHVEFFRVATNHYFDNSKPTINNAIIEFFDH